MRVDDMVDAVTDLNIVVVVGQHDYSSTSQKATLVGEGKEDITIVVGD